MKKIILSLMVMLMSMTTFAQTESEHLSFKGVPIDGTLKEYVDKMKQKGFDYLGMKDGMATLTGDFAAYRGCTIRVTTLKQKDLVSKITVTFPECETWEELSSNYFSLKDMLNEKYGTPINVTEMFQNDISPFSNSLKMSFVFSDGCKYVSTFETPKGDIQLRIGHDSTRCGFVVLTYFDKINGDIIRAQAMDDL